MSGDFYVIYHRVDDRNANIGPILDFGDGYGVAVDLAHATRFESIDDVACFTRKYPGRPFTIVTAGHAGTELARLRREGGTATETEP